MPAENDRALLEEVPGQDLALFVSGLGLGTGVVIGLVRGRRHVTEVDLCAAGAGG
jgi:hypothetical protein